MNALRTAAEPTSLASDRQALPTSLEANPRLSQWLRLRADGVVEVRVGEVELGQGIVTALAQIAAEELDVGIERIRMVAANTAESPDEGITSGSRSVEQSGGALRLACAEARARYLEAAATRLAVNVASLTVDDGEIIASNAARTSYWRLADELRLDAEPSMGAKLKDAASYRCVGTPVQRLDLPDKIFGQPVIEAAARRAGWHDWQRREGRGHGIGFAKYKNTGAYCAVIAEIEAELDIRVRRWCWQWTRGWSSIPTVWPIKSKAVPYKRRAGRSRKRCASISSA